MITPQNDWLLKGCATNSPIPLKKIRSDYYEHISTAPGNYCQD